MLFLSNIDLFLTGIIRFILPQNKFFDIFFSFFSLAGNSILIWAIIIAALLIFEEKRERRFVIYFFAAFLITAFTVNIVLKNVFQRQRPYIRFKQEISKTICPSDFSFPSGHAATAFAGAMALSCFHKKRKYYFYATAVLISLSRVYFQCHFFIDVVAGAVIGYLISRIICLVKN